MWVVVYGGGGAKMDVRGVGGMKGGKVEEGRGGQLNDRVLERVNAEMSQMVTSANNISNNLRLQRAINLINSKGVPEPPSKLQQAINNINNKVIVAGSSQSFFLYSTFVAFYSNLWK